MKNLKSLAIASLIPFSFGLTGCNGDGSDSSATVKPDGNVSGDIIVVDPGVVSDDDATAMSCYNPSLYAPGEYSAIWDVEVDEHNNGAFKPSAQLQVDYTYTELAENDQNLLKLEKVISAGNIVSLESSISRLNEETGEAAVLSKETGFIDSYGNKAYLFKEKYNQPLISSKFDLVKGDEIKNHASYIDPLFKTAINVDSSIAFKGMSTLSIGGTDYNVCKFVKKDVRSLEYSKDKVVPVSVSEVTEYWSEENDVLLVQDEIATDPSSGNIQKKRKVANSFKINGVEQL